MKKSKPASHAKALFGVERSARGRTWQLRPANDRTIAGLVQQHELPEPLARLLAVRGFDQQTAGAYLNPLLREQLPDPGTIKDVDRAVDRLVRAIRQDERIAILADYDADGATSAAIIKRYLRSVGVQSAFYIPDRALEGYGGSRESIDALVESGTNLCIMADCNSRAFELLEYAKKRGLSVIVLDHHKTETQLPVAEAIVNPMRLDDDTPHKQLVTAGLSFMAMIALNRRLRDREGFFSAGRPEPDLRLLLDLAAVGTVADVGWLTGINRVLVSAGLKVLNQRTNPGIAELLQGLGVDPSQAISAQDIGFKIGPHINAGGRIGNSSLGVKLLTEDDLVEVQNLSRIMIDTNMTRRQVDQDILEASMAEARRQYEQGLPVLVIHNEQWHPGVVGIVASRLREKFQLPAFVFGHNPHHPEGLMTGSGRSVDPSVDLGEAIILGQQMGMFKGGGHAMAAGATVHKDRIGEFQAFLIEQLGPSLMRLPATPVLLCDMVVDPGAFGLDLLEQQARLEPCGQGNPSPVYALQGLRLERVMPIGNGQTTLKCVFTKANQRLDAIVFRAANEPHGELLRSGQGGLFHVAGTAAVNHWQGRRTPQLTVEDVSLA